MSTAAVAEPIEPDPDGSDLSPLERLRARSDLRAARRRRPAESGPAAGAGRLLGRTEPRIWTPPLRTLSRRTSFGYDVCDFATNHLGRPPDPWQRWVLIHGGELLPDGRPRFRQVLVLVARQNGKTELGVLLAAHWMFVDRVPLILGTSNKLVGAESSLRKMVRAVEAAPDRELARKRARRWTRRANGQTRAWTSEGSEYVVAASNADGGRGDTVHRLLLDELRQHANYDAWDAAVPAGNAVDDFQAWCLTNAGSEDSIVLNDLRAAALEYIATGVGDERLGLFEYSAPDGADPLDLGALAQANPNVGRRLDSSALLSDARRAVQAGGRKLTGFKTESMCMRVPVMDPAVDPAAWEGSLEVGTLDDVRPRVALCLDVAPDAQHATLLAAAVIPDGRIRLEVIKAWSGLGCTDTVRRELPAIVRRIKPAAFGWLPAGPAAELAPDLRDRRAEGRRGWPPPGVTVAEIRTDVDAACMGFAGLVASKGIVHSGDPLLDAHVGAAEKLIEGDRWRFSRRGRGHVDAAYAAAGAVLLARTLRPLASRPRVVRALPAR